MFGHVTSITVDDCVAQRTMVKSCSAVGCAERWVSGSSIKWYRFPPVGTERRNAWIANDEITVPHSSDLHLALNLVVILVPSFELQRATARTLEAEIVVG